MAMPRDPSPPARWTALSVEPQPNVRDLELVNRARAGDLVAFERLYRSTTGLVYAVCMRIAGNAPLAEELTQEVFVRAWQKLNTFRGESAFSTWLTRLAVNVALTERRNRGRREKRITATDDLEPFAGSVRASHPGEAIDLERAISTLPEGARRVFVMHDVYGYQHDEIARLTGTAEGTSKAQLHRARKLLREALAL
jgi:RNA polymerase sigma-70 factor (ECF subfamily)